MINKKIKEKGILSNLVEKGIEILLKNECNKIGKIKIDIEASSKQILKGSIRRMFIQADGVNYKGLIFDEVELEANDIEIKFRINNNELKFGKNIIIKFKISLSVNSLKTIFLSNNWNWIWSIIRKEMLTTDQLEDIKIENGQIIINTSNNSITKYKEEKIDIRAKDGKLYLFIKNHNKYINIPIEDKVYIEKVNIKNSFINIFAESTVNF